MFEGPRICGNSQTRLFLSCCVCPFSGCPQVRVDPYEDFLAVIASIGGPFTRHSRAPLKGFGVDVILMRMCWLFLQIGGPFCGCP